MEPQACPPQLDPPAADETSLLAHLAQQLQREHELLDANDVEGLEQAGDARQDSVQRLLRVWTRNVAALRRLLGTARDHAGLAALLKWCDPSGSLADAHSHCASQAQRCREQNDRNGALVNARLNRLSGMLVTCAGAEFGAHLRTRIRRGTTRMPTGPCCRRAPEARIADQRFRR